MSIINRILGIDKRRKDRHEEFMRTLKSKSDEYLIQGYCALDSECLLGIDREYSSIKLYAIEEELDKRGYVDEYGHILYNKFKEKM